MTTDSRQLLKRSEVCALLGVHPVTLWRWERQGLFPQRIRCGPNTVAFLKNEVERWIDKKAAARSKRRVRLPR